jgi:hypothetical protein
VSLRPPVGSACPNCRCGRAVSSPTLRRRIPPCRPASGIGPPARRLGDCAGCWRRGITKTCRSSPSTFGKSSHRPHTCPQAYVGIADRKKQRPCAMTDHSPHNIYCYQKVELLGFGCRGWMRRSVLKSQCGREPTSSRRDSSSRGGSSERVGAGCPSCAPSGPNPCPPVGPARTSPLKLIRPECIKGRSKQGTRRPSLGLSAPSLGGTGV